MDWSRTLPCASLLRVHKLQVAPPAPRPCNRLLIYGGCLTSTAFDDVWYLEYSSPAGVASSAIGRSGYTWRQLEPRDAISSPLPLPAAPPPPGGSSSSGVTTLNATVAAPLPPSPPPIAAVAPVGRPSSDGSSPGARCAHSAVPVAGGMLVFGGRIPLPPRATYDNNDPAWRTLQDAWTFDIEASLRAVAAPPSAPGGVVPSAWSRLDVSMHTSDGATSGDSLSLNRSDHSCVVNDGSLMVFGGLYTDVAENTIYIMKDFLNMRLPASLGGRPGGTATGLTVNRLPWGPAWRFDHTMVIAPSVPHPDPRHSHRTLTSAPILYGGGGGMEIFGDTWVYDSDEGAWFGIDVSHHPTTRVSIITSMLFGTVGFGLYACVIVCVFVRRIANTRHGPGEWPAAQRLGGPGGVDGGARTAAGARRGAPPEVIAALPREVWSDVVKRTGGEVYDVEEQATISMKPVVADDEDEHDLCAVCLCAYEHDDVLLRLPCEHLFHEPCVARWLSQDSSCPQCRYQLMAPPAAHAVVAEGGSRPVVVAAAPDDVNRTDAAANAHDL